jgi:hypothetical protein
MNVDRHSLIVRRGSPVETAVGTEIVLMVLDAGKIYGLGETGSDVWRLLAEPTTVQVVVDALSEQYSAPAGVIEQDVLELLEELQKNELVEITQTA